MELQCLTPGGPGFKSLLGLLPSFSTSASSTAPPSCGERPGVLHMEPAMSLVLSPWRLAGSPPIQAPRRPPASPTCDPYTNNTQSPHLPACPPPPSRARLWEEGMLKATFLSELRWLEAATRVRSSATGLDALGGSGPGVLRPPAFPKGRGFLL